MANEDATEDITAALAALAHPLRMQVVRALVAAGAPGLTPGTIQGALAVPAATLSFHLKELNDAGLVTQFRSGRFLIYRAAQDRVDALLAFLHTNLGAPPSSSAPAAAGSARRADPQPADSDAA